MRAIDKSALIREIIAALDAELQGYARSARSAHAEATDEQSKAENKYDTRGLEASYLARGQSRQAAEVVEAIQQFQAIEPASFSADDPIDVGAVVEVEDSEGRTTYFMGPRGGGIEIVHGEDCSVVVITPSSPLGRLLTGRRQGEKLPMQTAHPLRTGKIVAVQ